MMDSAACATAQAAFPHREVYFPLYCKAFRLFVAICRVGNRQQVNYSTAACCNLTVNIPPPA